LRWLVRFKEGENIIRATDGKNVTDEIRFVYQTAQWDKPSKLVLREQRRVADVSVLQVTVHDAKDVLCLEARNFVRFDLAGDGRLIDNLGTSTTTRKVQLYNGRALISVARKGRSVVSASSDGLPTTFLSLE
jgi:beta-galactosidase